MENENQEDRTDKILKWLADVDSGKQKVKCIFDDEGKEVEIDLKEIIKVIVEKGYC